MSSSVDEEFAGSEPTLADETWDAAARGLTPENSINRIEGHAKFLFATVTAVGTLLTGFGLVTGGKGVGADPSRATVPLAFICASLALSMYALTPVGGRVNVDNLNDVRVYYGRRIVWRGRAIFAAGLLFALGLLSVVPTFARSQEYSTAKLSLKALRETTADTLTGSIHVTALPSGATVDTKATAITPTNTRVEVFRQSAKGPVNGEYVTEFAVHEARPIKQLELTVTAMADGRSLLSERMALSLAPRPAPPVDPSKPPPPCTTHCKSRCRCRRSA